MNFPSPIKKKIRISKVKKVGGGGAKYPSEYTPFQRVAWSGGELLPPEHRGRHDRRTEEVRTTHHRTQHCAGRVRYRSGPPTTVHNIAQAESGTGPDHPSPYIHDILQVPYFLPELILLTPYAQGVGVHTYMVLKVYIYFMPTKILNCKLF